MDIFLAAAGLITEGEGDGGPPEMLRVPDLPFDEESQDDERAEEHPIHAFTPWRQIISLLVDKLFNSIAMVVCILNVTAALGYLILMNDPAPPKSSYIIGYVLRSPFFNSRTHAFQYPTHMVLDDGDDDWSR